MERERKMKGTKEGGFSRPHRHFVRKGRRGKRDFRPHIEYTILVLDGPVLGLGNSEPQLPTLTGICEVLTCDKGKGKGHPRTGHEGPEGEYSYSSVLKLGARWGWVVSVTPWSLYIPERPGNHCIGGWVGPRAGLEGC